MNKNSKRHETKHGSENYDIKGEGTITGKLFPQVLLEWVYKLFKKDISQYPPKDISECGYHEDNDNESDEDESDEGESERKFCRLFAKGPQADSGNLTMLGLSMETEVPNPNDGLDSNIPGGYTYLGQFIDHDITQDRTPLSVDGTVDPDTIKNFRTQQFDLDSMYGEGPEDSSELYENDKKTLKVGNTTDVQGLGVFPNDLPRNGTTAIIGDHRNDENLAVAQTHLAFIKFHNAKVAADSSKDFEDIRSDVVQHYQAIVLTDFLPRVCDPDVVTDVIQNGCKFFKDDDLDCMPVEFAVAAYRMGHSMVRPSYEWNKIFSTGGQFGIATFEQLFEFSGISGIRGKGDTPFRGSPTLPSNWIVDWRRLYDFGEKKGGVTHSQLNFARQLDTQMTLALKNLPEFQQLENPPPEPLLSLATRNLLRGRLLSLPTGQAVAAAMSDTPLTAVEITDSAPEEQKQFLRDGFADDTPLWYYILAEAKIKGDGNHLGPVGSRIVAETLVGLISNTKDNVLEESPDLKFSMVAMLTFTNDINPLGD